MSRIMQKGNRIPFKKYLCLQVQALYHFEAHPGAGELTLTPGDIYTVTRADIGEGWLEGTNSRGDSGIFPEAYVEVG